jgi:hypothetical protein
MVKGCRRAAFQRKPLQPVRVGREGSGKNLDGNVAVEAGIAGAVHLAHTARAQGR